MKEDLNVLMDFYNDCGREPFKFLSDYFKDWVDKVVPGPNARDRVPRGGFLRSAVLTGYFIRCAEVIVGRQSGNEPEQHVKKLLSSEKSTAEKIEDIANYLDEHDRLGLQEKISNYSLVPFETIQNFLEAMARDHITEALEQEPMDGEKREMFVDLTRRNMTFGYLYKLSEEVVGKHYSRIDVIGGDYHTVAGKKSQIRLALTDLMCRENMSSYRFVIIGDANSEKYVQFTGGLKSQLIFDLPFQSLASEEMLRARVVLSDFSLEVISSELPLPSFKVNFGQQVEGTNFGQQVEGATELSLRILLGVHNLDPNFQMHITEN